jgi:3-isopropylmalate dehydratase small subunit
MPDIAKAWIPSFTGKNTGKVWVLGDDVTTDAIISGKFLEIRDFDELMTHVLEEITPEFARTASRGDIIVAGENFGGGSSREQAPFLLKRAGIGMICARSFARIFFRNGINIGLPLLEIVKLTSDEADAVPFSNGERVEYTIDPPLIASKGGQGALILKPLPAFFLNILRHGGAIPLLKKELQEEE